MGEERGRVYLVGAGPGHPKLITVRGMECLRESDAVVYDRLASPRLLANLKPGAQKIYVGKLPDRNTLEQEEINQLLVDLALEGKVVTRLKGGDPSIFARVAEEAELLAENGIEFEIVPGITSAIAAPVYAGIPVTHRELAASVSIITGHENPDKQDRSVQWERIAQMDGTLVLLMSVANIGFIAGELIRHGRSPDMPVAVIQWGTTTDQRTVTGTLATIESIVRAERIRPPAVIVVGEVVRHREKMQWAERRPLFGTRVLITRSRAQSSDLAERIEALGGEPCEFPVIETREPADPAVMAQVEAALRSGNDFDWILFTSVNGVDYFFRYLQRYRIDIRQFHRARIAAVGPKTAEALQRRGLVVEALPAQYQAEGLLDHLADELLPGQRVLLPRGDLARDILPRTLQAQGLTVVGIDVYETVAADQQDEEVLELLQSGAVDVITFASSSTVTNLIAVLRRMGVENPIELLGKARVACIGPVTARTAEEAGLTVDILPPDSTIDALVAAIAAECLSAHNV
ncbi:uroporphyrinogen-III C-methyltransferase [Paenibacillus methanolicus]|uniref:Uroporphyrinogen-III C-methyltransferase n=1 Tax=Paenibacillus methanolicus TaxID=582686 RepID=A0A5S5C3H8_9BACL|nr:uroporphyrinogen-III C-methyltransferase [Paenibacillus methanolicus]TYP73867.1 uroporphyrinogen III methyltransferase/synthase [Paenibacillus methanolicus]